MSRKHPGPDPTDISQNVSVSASVYGTHLDLCSTCNHAKTCGNRGTPERPILFCEQFEDSVPVSAPAPAAGLPETEQDAGEYKGLCTNCENRQSCTTSKQAGGVWHCEEYR